jgi:uncharacterized membrane protein YkvA (DUF1232 family)
MSTNGRRGEILQSITEIGALVSERFKQKVTESPLAASIAQGAAARLRSAIAPAAPEDATPAEVVSVADREPDQDAGQRSHEPHEEADEHGLKGILSNIPAIGILLWKLVTDPRVPTKNKVILGGAAAYVISPFDFVPDTIPGVGELDDFAVVVAALDIVLNRTDSQIVHEHWTGNPHTLDSIRRAVGFASTLRAGKVRRWMLREHNTD